MAGVRALLLPAVLAASTLGACTFSGGDLAGTAFLCDDEEPCPAGFSCVAGRCIAGDAGPIDAGPADACVPIDAAEGGLLPLYDDFADGVAAPFWSPYSDGNGTSVMETGGELVCVATTFIPPRFAGYRTSETYDLTAHRVFVGVTSMVNVESEAQARFLALSDDQNRIYMIQQAGDLRFGVRTAGDDDDLGVASYDPEAHRYWQLREEDGTVYGEVSADGQVWTELGTGAAPAYVEEIRIDLSAGTETRVDDPGAAHYDQVNGGFPACP